MTTEVSSINPKRMMQSINRLYSLGVRFAGSQKEKEAALWIQDEFQKVGLETSLQEFPCLSFAVEYCRFSFLQGPDWKTTKVEPCAHSPSTPAGGVEAELVVVEKIPSRQKECELLMGGRIVLVYNSELFELNRFKRTMKARPAAVLVVDDRFPNDWTVSVGFPRYWVDFITCPVVNLSYADAWDVVSSGCCRARLDLRADTIESSSQNVIAEIGGSSDGKEVIVVSAHHDSVMSNPGADDNCSGVASVLELARLFARSKPLRTLRFISYGAEEQLSEGARFYALSCQDVERIRFVLNIDSIGAWMGKTGLYFSGPVGLGALLDNINLKLSFPGHCVKQLSPFSDHFSLNLAGVPCVWYYRTTFIGGRHFHHSPMEKPDVISPEVLRSTVVHQADLLRQLSFSETFPFPRQIPVGQQRRLRKMARDWVGVK